ncbi:MAG TPA: hypothetical protein PLI57_10460 [Spirochaetota bacterium]|nr:hypothetical protein [Spirochaetota bacterium]
MCQFSSGSGAARIAPYASISIGEAARRMQLHMRRISVGERRDAYVSKFSSGSGAANMGQMF